MVHQSFSFKETQTEVPASFTTAHLLIVDDDTAIRNLLSQFLSTQGFEVKTAANSCEARLLIASHTFELIILDVMMPLENGLIFLQEFRQTHKTPVLMLTACDQLNEKILGLDIGADDYMTKPFEPLELVARIKSLLRRLQPLSSKSDMIQSGFFEFHVQSGYLSYKGEHVLLSSSERLLLQILARRPYEPISRQSLAQKIGHRVSERSVDVQINRLRAKLKSIDMSCEMIHTVRHLGYALMLPTPVTLNL